MKPEWMKLLTEFPDRFVLGGDQFFVSAAGTHGPAQAFAKRAAVNRRRTHVFLAALPQPLARKIATENAKRIYKLGG